MRALVFCLLSLLLFAIGASAQPTLTWGTYFGGTWQDNPTNIETDSKGNVYVSGAATSTNFPLLSGGAYFQGTGLAIDFAFISKFSPSGQLLWSIPYADSTNYSSTLILDVAIDHNDNVFVCGWSNGPFLPLKNNGTYLQQFNGGMNDAFVLKFDSTGTLLWATYFGGDRNDWGYSICLNNVGDLYLAGITTSSVFPLLNSGGYFNAVPDTNGSGYIARFNNNGTLLWSTFYQKISPWGTTIDTAQNLIVTGQAFAGLSTQSITGAFNQPVCAGLDDAGILKFDQNNNRSWATFFGGTSSDRSYSVEADKLGCFYLLAHTSSTNMPLQNSGGYYKPAMTGSGDAFLARFTGACALAWGTYYGGSSNEGANATDNFDFDACGNLYVGIDTYSTDMPFKKNCGGGYIDSTLAGVADHFICRFSPTQVIQWATYVGGAGFDFKTMLDVSVNGNIHMAATWQANTLSGLPLTNPGPPAYYDGTPNGLNDVGIVRFSNPLFVSSFQYPTPSCSQSGTINLTNAQLAPQGTFTSSAGLILNPSTGAIVVNGSTPGTYTITYSANQTSTGCNCTIAPQSVTSATYQVFLQPTVVVIGNPLVCPNRVATFTASGATSYQWSNGALTATAALNPTVSTQYYVIGMSVDGCPDTVAVILSPSLNPKVLVAGNTTICPHSVSTLTASGASSYLWSNGVQNASATFSPSLTTTYTVIGYFPDGCNDTVAVTLSPSQNPKVIVSGNNTICPNAITTLTASGAVNYLWSNGIQNTSATFSPALTSTFNVIGYFPDGCNDSVTVTIVIDICANLSDITKDTELLIFSNTSPGELRIKNKTKAVYFLYDLTGKMIKQIELDGSGEPATIDGIASGIYILRDQSTRHVCKVAVN